MCQLTRGFALDCTNAISGLKNIYLANIELIGTPAQNATGEITAFTGATGTPFKKYELKEGNADWNFTPTANEQAGTLFYANLLNFTLTKSEQAKRNEIKLLASGKGVCWIAEGWDGKYWCGGFKNGAKWTGGTGQVGRAMGDLNGYNVALTSNEPDAPAEVQLSVFNALVATNT